MKKFRVKFISEYEVETENKEFAKDIAEIDYETRQDIYLMNKCIEIKEIE
jgi:hypothetical protein